MHSNLLKMFSDKNDTHISHTSLQVYDFRNPWNPLLYAVWITM